MASGTLGAGTVTEVSVSIVRDPALVRTVRLVAAAVARRVTGDEELVEEVRLAVGEGCALLLGPDAPHPGDDDDLVEVALGAGDRLWVRVRARTEPRWQPPATGDVDGLEPWALLTGLTDDVTVVRDDGFAEIRMSWPLL